jgi:hypothetical protein
MRGVSVATEVTRTHHSFTLQVHCLVYKPISLLAKIPTGEFGRRACCNSSWELRCSLWPQASGQVVTEGGVITISLSEFPPRTNNSHETFEGQSALEKLPFSHCYRLGTVCPSLGTVCPSLGTVCPSLGTVMSLTWYCMSLTWYCMSLTCYCMSLTCYCMSLTWYCMSLTSRQITNKGSRIQGCNEV